MERPVETVHEFCREILESGNLGGKLRPPRREDGSPLDDSDPGPSVIVDAPARSDALRMHSGSERLPPLGDLGETGARTVTLSRFANHELQAVELFAWALLAWPEMPSELRRSYVKIIEDEQRHFMLYQERLKSMGSDFRDVPLSDYFWRNAPAILHSGKGIPAFLSAVGLTLEQANLDFALRYRNGFRQVKDEESAAVCQTIHDDEISHVRLAYVWLNRMKQPGQSDVDAYAKNVPFPFSASRAKGRGFDLEGRRQAGLSEELIEFVRNARPYEHTYRVLEKGGLLLPNLGAEEGAAWKKMRFRPEVERAVSLWRLLFGSEGRVLNDPSPLDETPWPNALGKPRPAFDWLENSGNVVPWLSTEEVEAYCKKRKLRVAAPSWEGVQRVHDKAFAQRVAAKEQWDSAELAKWIRIFEAIDFENEEAVLQEIERELSRWPEWARANFTLKPRFGSSGRGRVRGVDGKLDLEQPKVVFERLASCGGAILEPWFQRERDLSVQLWISDAGEIEVLGVVSQQVTASGMYRGHRGIITSDGEIRSGTPHDECLIEAARSLVQAAYAEGYSGPCGMDAFEYRDPESGDLKLRPVVEFNARFTMGTVLIGLLRLALEAATPSPGEASKAFYFGVVAPDPKAGWPEPDAHWKRLLLTAEEDASGPALCLAACEEDLRKALD